MSKGLNGSLLLKTKHSRSSKLIDFVCCLEILWNSAKMCSLPIRMRVQRQGCTAPAWCTHHRSWAQGYRRLSGKQIQVKATTFFQISSSSYNWFGNQLWFRYPPYRWAFCWTLLPSADLSPACCSCLLHCMSLPRHSSSHVGPNLYISIDTEIADYKLLTYQQKCTD